MVDGCRFIGASSIGAIRAAELARFGAIGIGEIYSAYASGRVEDEAYVYLEFHPRTYEPMSEPPCTNALKQKDALAAVAYARVRAHGEKPKCTLTKKSLGFGLQITLDRILATDYVLAHEHER
jgi:TfuA-like protein